jgi:hypothetical protein
VIVVILLLAMVQGPLLEQIQNRGEALKLEIEALIWVLQLELLLD